MNKTYQRKLDKTKQALCFCFITHNPHVIKSVTEISDKSMVCIIRRKSIPFQMPCKDRLPGIHSWGNAG